MVFKLQNALLGFRWFRGWAQRWAKGLLALSAPAPAGGRPLHWWELRGCWCQLDEAVSSSGWMLRGMHGRYESYGIAIMQLVSTMHFVVICVTMFSIYILGLIGHSSNREVQRSWLTGLHMPGWSRTEFYHPDRTQGIYCMAVLQTSVLLLDGLGSRCLTCHEVVAPLCPPKGAKRSGARTGWTIEEALVRSGEETLIWRSI